MLRFSSQKWQDLAPSSIAKVVIRIDKPITVMLPFHRHGLRLSHRLLTNLGGVSRFILSALDHGLTVDMIANVTALSPSSLKKQLEFLSQHGFAASNVDDPGRFVVSDRGRRMIDVERLLQRDEHTVWLDAFTLKRQIVFMLAGIDEAELQPASLGHSSEHLSAAMPVRERAYHKFDQLNRVRGLLEQDALVQLLTACWPNEERLIQEELDHWEYSLIRSDDHELRYLALVFPAGALTLLPPSNQALAWPNVALPVVELTTRFGRAKNVPWRVDLPETEHRIVELVCLTELKAMHWFQADPSPGSSSSASLMELPGSNGADMPELAWTPLPPGVSATADVRRSQLTCSLDIEALPQRLLSEWPRQVLMKGIRVPAEVFA